MSWRRRPFKAKAFRAIDGNREFGKTMGKRQKTDGDALFEQQVISETLSL